MTEKRDEAERGLEKLLGFPADLGETIEHEDRKLTEVGTNVGLHGKSPAGEAICNPIRKMGRNSFFLASDAADAAVCSAVVSKTIDESGSIDNLVNNAVTSRRAPVVKHPQAFWNELIATNLSSVFYLSQLAGQDMLQRGMEVRSVNLAPLLSFQGGILVPVYAVAKGGVTNSAGRWPKSGHAKATTSMRSRPTTLRHCAAIHKVAGRSGSEFLRGAGAIRRGCPVPLPVTGARGWLDAGWRESAEERSA